MGVYLRTNSEVCFRVYLGHRQQCKSTIDCATCSSRQASRGPLCDTLPIVINSRSIDICMSATGCIYDRWVYEWTNIGLIIPSACQQALCIDGTDIRISGGRTEPSVLVYDYLYSAATCIENAAVQIDGGWISYNCTMSVWQL